MILNLPEDGILPGITDICNNQGITENAQSQFAELIDQARQICRNTISAKVKLSEIDVKTFGAIYNASGQNEIQTPLQDIFPESRQLYIFALTLGEEVCREIQRLFDIKDYPLGALVDATASLAADQSVKNCELWLKSQAKTTDSDLDKWHVLAYSPGYCGWHVSGQKALFHFLQPEEIGITLNKSFLMSPIKSVSGVLVAGSKNIHQFINNFEFCNDCSEKTCRARISALQNIERSQ